MTERVWSSVLSLQANTSSICTNSSILSRVIFISANWHFISREPGCGVRSASGIRGDNRFASECENHIR